MIAGIEIPLTDQTPFVLALVTAIKRLEQETWEPRDEIDRLKGTTCRPKLTPSRLLEKYSFHAYLHDRLKGATQIPLLGSQMRAAAAAPSTPAVDTASDTG